MVGLTYLGKPARLIRTCRLQAKGDERSPSLTFRVAEAS